MSVATRRFGGASGAAARKIRRHRKAKAWGVEWARARDSKPWRSSSVTLSGLAKGTGMVALLTGVREIGMDVALACPQISPFVQQKTDEGFTKWTSSYSELMAVVGFRSKNAAYKLVERFVQRDWLDKDATGRLLPGRLLQDLPVLGTVSAGFPSPADEELTDTMSLDEYLIGNKEASALHPQHDTKE